MLALAYVFAQFMPLPHHAYQSVPASCFGHAFTLHACDSSTYAFSQFLLIAIFRRSPVACMFLHSCSHSIHTAAQFAPVTFSVLLFLLCPWLHSFYMTVNLLLFLLNHLVISSSAIIHAYYSHLVSWFFSPFLCHTLVAVSYLLAYSCFATCRCHLPCACHLTHTHHLLPAYYYVHAAILFMPIPQFT